MNLRRFRTILVWPLLAFALIPAPAGAAVPQRVRGSIESVTQNHIVVNDRSGVRVDVQLTDTLTVLTIVPLDASAIVPGRDMAVVTRQERDGSIVAVRVLALTEAMATARDGGMTWDLQPDNRLLVGRIGGVGMRNGIPELTVSCWDGTKVVSVPANTPVGLVRQAARSDLTAGKTVVLVGPVGPDGSVSADRVVVSQEAPKPPS